MTYLIFFLGIALNAFASFTLKVLGQGNNQLIALKTLTNPLLYLALALYALNVVFYALLLQRVNLAIGYPIFVGGTFIIVLGLSFFILRETLSPTQIIGITLIFAGTVLAVR